MSLGKQIGEFSLKETSTTSTPGSGGAVNLQGNFRGQVSGEAGEGVALGTLTIEFEPNMQRGTWSYCGMTASSSGGGNTVKSQGTCEETSPLKFRYRGTGQFSDGRTFGVEFDGIANTEEWVLSGKLYEWS